MAAEVMRFDVPEPVFEVVGPSGRQRVTWAWARQDLDLATVTAAQAELAALLSDVGSPAHLLVHLGSECFVDVHGLRLLVDVADRMRAGGGTVVVIAPPSCLRRMVSVMGLEARLSLATSARQLISCVHLGSGSPRGT